jgi:hypothetical protein
MVTVPQIREQLVDLLASFSDESLSSFEEWLATASWNMHLVSDYEAQKFAGEIQLRIAESEAENRSLGWLKEEMKSILSRYSLSFSQAPASIASGSSTSFSTQQWVFSTVDKLRAAASA